MHHASPLVLLTTTSTPADTLKTLYFALIAQLPPPHVSDVPSSYSSPSIFCGRSGTGGSELSSGRGVFDDGMRLLSFTWDGDGDRGKQELL